VFSGTVKSHLLEVEQLLKELPLFLNNLYFWTYT